MRPRRMFCRARRDWRTSFDLSAACGIVRPLNFTVRRPRGPRGPTMKRWLVICAAAVGVFALGAVTGSLLENRAHAQMYRTMCLSLFVEHGSEALLTMTLLAEGHTDSVYDLAESAALLC